jgi:hypothetical protein
MGVFEDIAKNKEELLMKIFSILEGKETKTKLNLDNIEFNFGNSKVKLNGSIEFTVIPFAKKK